MYLLFHCHSPILSLQAPANAEYGRKENIAMKSLFEDITDREYDILLLILENPNILQGDFLFDEPAIDGFIEMLSQKKLISISPDDELNITELGRAAILECDLIRKHNETVQRQHDEELSAYKSIADSMSKQVQVSMAQSESADKNAKFSKVTSIIAIIISIIALIVPWLY
jgi:hypothetical protein